MINIKFLEKLTILKFNFLILFLSVGIGNNLIAQQYGANSFALAPEGLNVIAAMWEHQGVNMLPSGALFKNSELKIDVFSLSYSKYFSVAGKTAQVNFAVPYLFIESKTDVYHPETDMFLGTLKNNTNGFADPYIHFAMALIGGDAIKPQDFAEYNGGFTVHGLFAIRVPVGTYDSNKVFNAGQNRFEFRLGVPVVKSWGKPGKSTSLEFTPVVAFYTANNDINEEILGGTELKQKPLYRFEVHTTHDFITGLLALGVDLVYQVGGETAIDRVNDDNIQNFLAGGFHASGRFSRKIGWGAVFGYPIIATEDLDKAAFSRVVLNYSF
jgi:hypothetical protein